MFMVLCYVLYSFALFGLVLGYLYQIDLVIEYEIHYCTHLIFLHPLKQNIR